MTNQMDGIMLCSLDDPQATELAASGGKSAGLSRLLRANLPVPPGFVVTTMAFEQVIGRDAGVRRALERLERRAEGASSNDDARAVREAVMACAMPEPLARSVVSAWTKITGRAPVAVRSSATAEDLEGASFAGQQDTFLSVDSEEGLLRAILACWASLFTERAVIYRRNHGFDSARVSIAVVVQRMVRADAAGVLFTADPVNGHRGVSVIEAVAGLGEALVSGHVTPERYRVRSSDRAVLERAGSDGAPLSADKALLRGRALEELCAFGLRAQEHAGMPLDIEWALEGDRLWLLQARPITTLWPLPEGEPLPGWRVLLSFGHLQVYTSALSRVGTAMFRRMVPFGRDERTGLSSLVRVAGERAYLDVTPMLVREPFRTILPAVLSGASEPIAARLETAKQRDELRAVPDSERISYAKFASTMLPMVGRAVRAIRNDPRRERDAYAAALHEQAMQQGERVARAKGLAARLDVLFEELGVQFDGLFSQMFPRMFPAIVMGKLVGRLAPWLEPSVDPRALLQGLEGNVTTEMDLALSDLADIARDVPSLVVALRSKDPRTGLEALRGVAECASFFRAWDDFLARYGHRSAGEIDPQVPRWREDPRIPLRSIAGALDRPAFALRAQHAALSRRALACRDELVAAARKKPFGALLAPLTAALVDRMRTFQGAREHHKFALVVTIDLVRSLVLEAGVFLERAGALASRDEVWSLEIQEIRDAVRAVESGNVPSLRELVAERRALRERFATASPPAVMTSEGEVLSFVDAREVPPHSLVGTAVSGGVCEGVARVLHDPATEQLGAGEVLVARFTDPGWTPLFGHAGALVMEVGGQMTHGSVIAREIGIPAVVAVEGATSKLRTGDRVRVDGERGWVTVLEGGLS